MPFCEVCKNDTPPENLMEDPSTTVLVCRGCFGKPHVEVLPKTFLGRDFNYDFSYSRKEGFKAQASLGKATLTLHVPQDELIKTFG